MQRSLRLLEGDIVGGDDRQDDGTVQISIDPSCEACRRYGHHATYWISLRRWRMSINEERDTGHRWIEPVGELGQQP